MKITLEGKTVLVGGASKGIGKSVAEHFAKAGARCILMARNYDALSKVHLSLVGEGHEVLVCDVTDHEDLREKIKTKTVDIVVNNTGGPPGGPLLEASIEDLQKAYDLHVKSSQIIAKNLVPTMNEKRWGRIINIISTSVKQPIPNLGVSNTIRGAMGNWSKTLATELGSFGITVNNILPGATETERLSELINKKAEKNNLAIEDVTQRMRKEIPSGRFAHPNEIAFGACFLASDKASYINGVNLVIDGGRTASL